MNHGACPHGLALLVAEVDHLDALAFDHVKNLFGSGMVVALVPLSRLERHHTRRDALGTSDARLAQSLNATPVEYLRFNLLWFHKPFHACLLCMICLNARVCSVMARSTASRSMLDAPKNPCTPCVRSRMKRASSGSAIGPPWQITRTSLLTAAPASRMACTRSAACSSVRAVRAPIVPFVVSPICATKTSAPASTMRRASCPLKTYGQVSMSSWRAWRIISTSRP